MSVRAPKVLVLSRSYPNNITGLLGLWVKQVVNHSTGFCEPRVISPVPWCPPLPAMPESFSRFRRVDRQTSDSGVPVYHPRFLAGPGYSLYDFEWQFYYAAVRGLVDRVRGEFPFDLIHAHFTYPDGAVAVRLAQRYRVPVVITEHIPWNVWDSRPRVKRRAAWAVRNCRDHLSVSESVRRSVMETVGHLPNLSVVPNGVNGSIFDLAPEGRVRKTNQILFAGAVRPVKGVDVLLRAMRILLDRKKDVRLVIAGEPFYGRYRQEESNLRALAQQLNIGGQVDFVGKKSPAEVAALMQQSAMLVLPSRIESFGMVLVEALACGTPVVSTRCGGPEEIVTEQVGALAAPEDPEALAEAIDRVLSRAAEYAPERLREYALQNFGLESVGRRLEHIYKDAIRPSPPVKSFQPLTAAQGCIVAGVRSKSELSPDLLQILCCPLCKNRVVRRNDSLVCRSCDKTYPIVLGIPDLRVYEDPLIPIEDDYRKSAIIAAESEKRNFADLVRFYWSLPTYPHTPPHLKERFIRQVLSQDDRIRSHARRFPGGRRFLDVGCGTAAFAKVASSRYRLSVGCDVAFRWLLIARKRLEEAGLPANLVCCCADHLPFVDGAFDGVGSISLLEHLEVQNKAISEFERVTAPGGLMFISTSNRFSAGLEPHVRIWGVGFLPRRWMPIYVRLLRGIEYEKKYQVSKFELRRLLENAGFRNLRFSLPEITPIDWEQLAGLEKLGAQLFTKLSKIPFARSILTAISPVIQVQAAKSHGESAPPLEERETALAAGL